MIFPRRLIPKLILVLLFLVWCPQILSQGSPPTKMILRAQRETPRSRAPHCAPNLCSLFGHSDSESKHPQDITKIWKEIWKEAYMKHLNVDTYILCLKSCFKTHIVHDTTFQLFAKFRWPVWQVLTFSMNLSVHQSQSCLAFWMSAKFYANFENEN